MNRYISKEDIYEIPPISMATNKTHEKNQKTSTGENVNKQKTLRPLVGIQNRTATVKNSTVVSQKLKAEYCKIW